MLSPGYVFSHIGLPVYVVVVSKVTGCAGHDVGEKEMAVLLDSKVTSVSSRGQHIARCLLWVNQYSRQWHNSGVFIALGTKQECSWKNNIGNDATPIRRHLPMIPSLNYMFLAYLHQVFSMSNLRDVPDRLVSGFFYTAPHSPTCARQEIVVSVKYVTHILLLKIISHPKQLELQLKCSGSESTMQS